jgi:Cu/Ag efflux pump CusA
MPGQVVETVQAAYDGVLVGRRSTGSVATPIMLVADKASRADVTRVGALPLRSASGELITVRDVADVGMADGRYKILRDGGRRVQTVIANLTVGEDPERFVDELQTKLLAAATPGGGEDKGFSRGSHFEVLGAAQAQSRARAELLTVSAMATVGVLGLLLLAFGSARTTVVAAANLPFALIGGVAAVLFTGGLFSLGSLVGFVTLFGITLRNSIMLVSHYRQLVELEGHPWGIQLAVQGAQERLPSILMTALVTGLGLLPLALGSAEPGREIEGPMAIIIVGGLVSSTVLNLLILPTLLLRFGRFVPPVHSRR